MKKILSMLLTVPMIFTLAACGTSGEQSGTSALPADTGSQIEEPSQPTSPEQSETSPDNSGSSEDSTDSSAEVPVEDGGKTLIAYFSWSGNTETLAGMIQEATGGDLFAIETETPYSDDYNTVVDQAKQEQADNIRPALAARVENMDDYDTIFIGYPNWWGDVPMAVLTFLESYDWSGKTLILFCTSGGGGFGNGINSIEAATGGATILEGFHVDGSSVDNAADDVAAWLNGLGL